MVQNSAGRFVALHESDFALHLRAAPRQHCLVTDREHVYDRFLPHVYH